MIKEFLRIRINSIRNKEYKEYLIFALGEILLIVIGILIALQIDNWNQSKISSKQEAVLIENLKTEFEVNLANLEEVKIKNNLLYNSTHLSAFRQVFHGTKFDIQGTRRLRLKRKRVKICYEIRVQLPASSPGF